MNVNEMFPGKNLKAGDLKGGDKLLTIESISTTTFDEGGQKYVVNFAGEDKSLVLNKTNTNRIADQHGEDTEQWVGKQITLFADRVDFKGEIVDAIRVRIGGGGAAPISNGVEVIGEEGATTLYADARDNEWPKDEIKRLVAELANVNSMVAIPVAKLKVLQGYFNQKFTEAPDLDSVPF